MKIHSDNLKAIITSAIIGVVAVGMIVLFTNTENSSVEKTEEIPLDITIGNQIKKYQVNTKCELIYVHLKSVERDGSPWPIDEAQIRELQDEIIEDAKQKTAKIDHENTEQEDLENINSELSEELENKIANHIVEQNSINPKFKEIVRWIQVLYRRS